VLKDPGMRRSPHLIAILQALLVTFLWSTSWVLIKIGLADLPPLLFAGVRYTLAALILAAAYLARPGAARSLRSLSRGDLLQLGLLGILLYSVAQGSMFFALSLLPAIPVNLVLTFTTPVVSLMGVVLLREWPGRVQWAGVLLAGAGGWLYFTPFTPGAMSVTGLAVAGLCMLANAGASILGRRMNRRADLDPMLITLVSMGMGSLLLLGVGAATATTARFSLRILLILVWLAAVNTAFAFTLWNWTLRSLTAVESSVLNSTMMVQIAILAWMFLGEGVSWRQVIAMGMTALGAVLVQLRTKNRAARVRDESIVAARDVC
jgi:drug/metabolite transporter (DMT)-like permease